MTRMPFNRPRATSARARAALCAFSALMTPILTVAPTAGRVASAQVSQGSERTLAGKGEFANLRVTVSQTKNLVNQGVDVSWSGGKPTPVGNYSRDFMHIMQCWGDDAAGPDRTQCQFGGLPFNPGVSINFATVSRAVQTKIPGTVSAGKPLLDPLETLAPTDARNGTADVPFRPVLEPDKPSTAWRQYFDENTTNELFVRTSGEGSGKESFEIQTAREAQGLGCGTVLADSSARSCWLVVVPRGHTEVDGTLRNNTGVSSAKDNWLWSSALNATNWANRIVFPLEFAPLGLTCPLGRAERPTLGSELVADAVIRWQPALCAGDGAVYSYSGTPELIARRKLSSREPGLAFLSRPLPVDQLAANRRPIYAPVALSGLGIGFNIQRTTNAAAPAAVKARDGVRVENINLTARLVAKLLTQSYLTAGQRAEHVRGNPENLLKDPEFRRYNPGLESIETDVLYDVVVPDGLSDSAGQLWHWIQTDPEAKAFLAGVPDPDGMTVNPYYKGMELPRDDFPKRDPYCRPDARVVVAVPAQPSCAIDHRPKVSDLHAAARAANRGDPVEALWTWEPAPARFRVQPPPPNGSRQVLAFTDTGTASRYGLPMARLRNAAGVFVAPTDNSLRAGMEGMAPSGVPGVLASDPLLGEPGAYPLTQISYAATVPDLLSPAAASDYSKFIRYAVVSGQIRGESSGQLPAGYVPLPQRLRDQALDVADLLVRPKPSTPPASTMTSMRPQAPTTPKAPPASSSLLASPSAPTTTPQSATQSSKAATTPAPATGSTSSASSSSSSSPALAGGSNSRTTTRPTTAAPMGQPIPATDAGTGSPTTAPAIALSNAVSPGTTPREPLGKERYAFLALLVLGSLAALAASSEPVAAKLGPYAAPVFAKVGKAAGPAVGKARVVLAPVVGKVAAATLPVGHRVASTARDLVARLPWRDSK